MLGVIAAAAALGAAALAALGGDTGAWLTRSVLGPSTDTRVPYTLRELGATHVLPGYSLDFWVIGVGAIALSCGGLLALIAGRRRNVRWFSCLGISLGVVFASYVFYLKPDPPRYRPVSGGEFILWSNGSAQSQVRQAILFGWIAFGLSNLALFLLFVRDRRVSSTVTFPMPKADD